MTATPPSTSGSLDHAGRWLLTVLDYREVGLLILLIIAVFALWRRIKFSAWPRFDECGSVLFAVLAIISGITVMIVFLLTKPPAVDLLPDEALEILGIMIPILFIWDSGPKIKAAFVPKQAPKPPAEMDTAAASKDVKTALKPAIETLEKKH